MTDHVDKTPATGSHASDCPVCSTEVGGQQTGAVVCASCGVPHHGECWKYNGKCGIFACGSDKPLIEATSHQDNQATSLIPSETISLAPVGALQRVGEIVKAAGTSISELPFSVAESVGSGVADVVNPIIQRYGAPSRCLARACVGEPWFNIREGETFKGTTTDEWVITGVTIPGPRGLEERTVEILQKDFKSPHQIPEGYHAASLPEIAGICRTLYRNRLTLERFSFNKHADAITRKIAQTLEFGLVREYTIHLREVRVGHTLITDTRCIHTPAGTIKSVVHHQGTPLEYSHAFEESSTGSHHNTQVVGDVARPEGYETLNALLGGHGIDFAKDAAHALAWATESIGFHSLVLFDPHDEHDEILRVLREPSRIRLRGVHHPDMKHSVELSPLIGSDHQAGEHYIGVNTHPWLPPARLFPF